MTSVDERPITADVADLLLAVELVITSQHASAAMLQRKLRTTWADSQRLLNDLAAHGVVSGGGPGDRTVLVPPEGLADTLASITSDSTSRPEPGQCLAPDPVSLVKPDQDSDGQPGVALVVRPDDDLVPRQPGDLAWPDEAEPELDASGVQVLVVRARQATARAVLVVADQPVVARGLAIGHQVPTLAWRLVLYSPRGLARAVVTYRNHLRDQQTLDLLAHYHDTREGPEYEKVMKAREAKNLPGRQWLHGALVALLVAVGLAWWAPAAFGGVLGVAVFVGLVSAIPKRGLGELVMAAVAGGLGWWFGPALAALVPHPPAWSWWALLAAVPVLGWFGWPKERPLVDMPATMAAHEAPPITAPMVIGALIALGNSKMKDLDSVRVLMDPHRAGKGVRLDLELPQSVTAAWVMENREKFAAALRRELGTVWPSVGNRHPGHLSVFVSDQVMAEAEQDPWPLLESGAIDIFAPQPVFTDQIGDWIKLNLSYVSVVIGAVPRMGKTFTMRELLLIFGLDPRVKVIALDGKGTGDFAPISLFAHGYVRGARPDKPEQIEKVRSIVAWLLSEMGRRADVIADLSADECPESKVTGELINARPELGLEPIVMGIDETQTFFGYGFRGNKDHKAIREEIRDGVIELMKMGPALGIWVLLSTQQVRDSTIPTEAQANAVVRIALKMEGWEPNDKVLGTGAYKSGVDATMFDFSDKGVCILKAEGQRHVICRSVMGLDAVVSRRIAARCRQMRVTRGTLTGDAGDDGIEDAEIVIDIVEDVERVMRHHQCDKAQHSEVVDWLRELREENYAALDVDELSARLRARGVPISQVWSSGRNAKGVKLADLRKQVEP